MAQAVENTDEIEISGEVTVEFSDKDSIEIKEGSFLYVSFQDTSLMDAPSKQIIDPVIIKVKSGTYKKDEIKISYSFKCERPQSRKINGGTTLSCVLNNGWNRKDTKDEWIRKGDCLTTSTNNIIIDEESKKFNYNMKMQLYS